MNSARSTRRVSCGWACASNNFGRNWFGSMPRAPATRSRVDHRFATAGPPSRFGRNTGRLGVARKCRVASRFLLTDPSTVTTSRPNRSSQVRIAMRIPPAVLEVRIERLRRGRTSHSYGGRSGGGDRSGGSGGGGSISDPSGRERKTMTTAMTPITKRNPTKAPNPSVARASIRTPSGGGGGGGALAGRTCIHIDMVSYPTLASVGTTFSTRIVRLCSPTPTARNCGGWTRADAPGASESERGVTPIRTRSPFGRESISSTVAEIAAVSPTLTTVTVTSTTSPSYGGTGLIARFAGRRSGPNCARTGWAGFAPAMRSGDAMNIPKRTTSPPRRPQRSGADHARPTARHAAPENITFANRLCSSFPSIADSCPRVSALWDFYSPPEVFIRGPGSDARGPRIRAKVRPAECRLSWRKSGCQGGPWKDARRGREPAWTRTGSRGPRGARRRGREPPPSRDAEGGAVRDRPGTPRKGDDSGRPKGTPSAPERRRRQGRPSPRAVPERPPPYRERAGVRPE